ncbi:protein nervous wreck [Schistocerca cancellata]|uniref:protein nervous wreck n=1 Tax=Schistocerca cancellata TaxID=274614 RepID=UPI0021177F87|nr:protein nervous wreck [Schistocerca cancellata]
MQPPPRKGTYAKFLTKFHSEQVTKLQAKNQYECDLLEDIRNYTLKRSAIEKSYSEALLKISSAYLNKKIPNIPDIKTEGGEEKWNMWNVWRTVLEENEKLARARLAAVEVFHQQIADDAKVLRSQKVQNAKKSIDQLVVVQKELQQCVQDVDKNKKLYFDEEHSAHDVRDKAKDIEEKLKKKKGSFFQSITSLQKNSAKVSSKREQLEEKSTGARNDYLLSIAAANAHQNRYFTKDLQNTMVSMENRVFEKVADYLSLIGRTELLTCTATQTSFTRIRDQAQQLTREYNLQCLYLFYPVLKQHIQYEFEPCENDSIDKVTADHSSAQQQLSKEAKRWATRIARDKQNVAEYERRLMALQALRDQGQKVDPNDVNGPDLETKIEDLKHSIRRSETSKVKAEARIECLRAGGVNVDEWLQEADSLSVQDMPRSASSLSMRTDGGSGQGEAAGSDSLYDSDVDASGSEVTAVERGGRDEEAERQEAAEVDGEWAMVEAERQRLEQLTAGWDDPTNVDWGPPDDSEPPPSAGADSTGTEHDAEAVGAQDAEPRIFPPGQTFKCIALYNYTAQNADELSIVENEQLEVVGEGDGDGWLRARNYRGEEGFVPQNYLDVEQTASAAGAAFELAQQISFSSVDYTLDDDTAVVPEDELQHQQQLQQQQQQQQQQQEQQPVEAVSPLTVSASGYCVALYDYEATCEDELTFSEGQVIRVLSKEPHSVDDGWWAGEIAGTGHVGLFPSLVVEECREDGEPLTPPADDEAPSSAPPVFTPPDVPSFLLAPQTVVTQPTPEIESSAFSMQMTGAQHQQYGSQFSGGPPSIVTGPETIGGDDVPSVMVQVTDEAGEESGTGLPVGAASSGPEAGGESSACEPSAPPTTLPGVGMGGGLGVAQIVITAATPTVEEPEQPFPPPPDPDEEAPEAAAAEADGEVPPRGPGLAGADSEEADAGPDSAPDDDEEPPTTASDEDESLSAPSTADNSSQAPVKQQQQQEEEEEECAVPPMRQPLGGRASIPDELEPHQLAQLQDLKESNA